MTQPPVPGRGAGADPAPDAGLPGGRSGPGGPGEPGGASRRRGRDPRLAGFAQGGPGDGCRPGAALAVTLEEQSGPGWRCDGATDDELIGLLGRWQAAESWAAAGKLGVVRELIRRRARPGIRGHGVAMHGDLPDAWEEGLGHEISGELAVSLRSADQLADLAWQLQARLPGIGAKLADGTIDYLKAKIVTTELSVLNDEQAAAAEKLVLDELAGKTPGQVGKLAARAACTVDPEGARKRRERAERDEARVRLWRENGGACALAGYGLPTDEALAAHANVSARAEQYKAAGAFPDARMDQLRVLAYLDLLNAVSAAARIARAQAEAGDQVGGRSGDRQDEDGDDGVQGGSTGSATNTGDVGAGTATNSGDVGAGLPATANLTIPLATLLSLAERPGEAHGLGPLDPALARDLAVAAASSSHSKWCVTVTDPSGIAVGHGCARPARNREKAPPSGKNRDGPPARTRWAFTPSGGPGPPGGYGTWALTLPDGRGLTVKLGPIPVTDCDHAHQSRGYQPSDTLRHLVEIRDGTCTFPACSRHARGCDFEHAIPHHQGGKTCACNGGARSRKCHRVKQSRGWSVTQPRPGWHRWTTPSGRSYTQGPMQYPT